MAANGTVSEVLEGRLVRARARRSDSLWAEAARRFRRHRLAMVGLVVLAAMVRPSSSDRSSTGSPSTRSTSGQS